MCIYSFVFFVLGPELKLSTSKHTTGINKSQTIGSATRTGGSESEVCGRKSKPKPWPGFVSASVWVEESYLKNRKIEIIIATATDSQKVLPPLRSAAEDALITPLTG